MDYTHEFCVRENRKKSKVGSACAVGGDGRKTTDEAGTLTTIEFMERKVGDVLWERRTNRTWARKTEEEKTFYSSGSSNWVQPRTHPKTLTMLSAHSGSTLYDKSLSNI